MDWINLAQKRNKWWVLVNTVVNFWVTWNEWNCFTGWRAVSVTIRAVSVTTRAVSVTIRAVSVTIRAISVTIRAVTVTIKAVSVTIRAVSVTIRTVPCSLLISLHKASSPYWQHSYTSSAWLLPIKWQSACGFSYSVRSNAMHDQRINKRDTIWTQVLLTCDTNYQWLTLHCQLCAPLWLLCILFILHVHSSQCAQTCVQTQLVPL